MAPDDVRLMDRFTLRLTDAQQGHKVLAEAWPRMKGELLQGRRLHVEVREEKRSDEQNRRMWAMLTDIARQIEWYGKKLDAESWKHVFSSGLKKLDVVPNLDGTGFVALGLSTSKMTKAEMGDMMLLMESFGAERGVKFSQPEDKQ